jgi:hypothetical protein
VSGIGMVITLPKVPGGHQALPVPGSCYEEGTSLPANLRAEGSYPVIAVCKRCHERIRLDDKRQMEWAHVPAAGAGSTAG